MIAEVAEPKGWTVYLVGGVVRDLLLGFVPNFKGGKQALTDIDIVVEGAESGAGMALAEALQSKYPQISAQVHGQFQTAALTWPSTINANSSVSLDADSLPLISIDIATARTEFYPYPAANPEVAASSIAQDLYRRDFTINAMAIRLTKVGDVPVGTLLDPFDGWTDLQNQQVRVLHRDSFIDDPTRIFRAVRFAVRLGFSLETQTEQLVRTSIDSGIYEKMRADSRKTPALQSRLKAELVYLLQTKNWEAALQKIDRLGAWACLDSTISITPLLWRQLRRMDRWLTRFGVQPVARQRSLKDTDSVRTSGVANEISTLKTGALLKLRQPRWLILLELLLLQLPSEQAVRVADNLSLDASSRRRLEKLRLWEACLLEEFAVAQRPSQLYWLLKKYELCELLLMSDRHPYTLGPQIWQYILRLSQVASPIDGATLKRLGLQPGPKFREILTEVHRLVLDGELATSQDAEKYVLTHYLSS